jgi:hypothetical protein
VRRPLGCWLRPALRPRWLLLLLLLLLLLVALLLLTALAVMDCSVLRCTAL